MTKGRWVAIGLFLVGQLFILAASGAAQSDRCRVGQELDPGDYCTVDIPNISVGTNRFEVRSDGRGCYGGICSGNAMNLNGFEASRIAGTSRWRIDALPGGGTTNQPPRATGSVPPQTLTVGGGSASMNMARYFTDPDGDRLTYEAGSSRTGVARASMSGSTVTLSPVSAGTATVTITARDPDGASATQAIAVTVRSSSTGASDRDAVLAALVDFRDVDEAQRPFSREDIVNLLRRNDDSLARFTWETSRNLVSVDFDVLDWITVDKQRTDYPLGGRGVVEDAVSAISYHADLSQYDKVLLFIFPLEQGYPGCQAYLGPVRWSTPNGTFELGAAWLSGYDMGCVEKGRIAHEYMHTFGFVHSYLIGCPKEPPVPASLIDPTDKNDSCFTYPCVDDDCRETRRSDSSIIANADWDVLGGDHKYEELFPLHVHATWQAQAGWLGEDQVIEANRGRYRITTLESLDSRPKAIRVPLGIDAQGEPAYYWLQTREFSPWTFALRRSVVEDLSPCQVDVRLEATGVFGHGGGSFDSKNTYIFDGYGIELTNGQRREILGESIVRPQSPFHDPYRGIRMKIVDCVEEGDPTSIELLIETTPLTVGPSIVAHLHDEQTTATITVTNGGTKRIAMGSAAIGGRHPAAFSVLSDGCGRLQPGGSCAVVVSYDGRTVGNPNHHAVLKIPNDDGLAPELSVSLFGEVGRPADANRRPVVLENLPDRGFTSAGTLEVDVSRAFADPEGEELSYTVSSSAPQVVATRVAGSVVTLMAASEGVAAIGVTATDPGGLSVTQSFGVTVGRGNRPPAAVGALPPVTLGMGGAPVRVDVDGAFRDPDGDALTYGAASSAPAVASVAVSGSSVTVTPVAAGRATVTVTATDAGGSNTTATQSFAVTVTRQFTDHPLVPGVTRVRAVHFTELRTRIDALRSRVGLGRFAWTDPVLRAGVTPVGLVHLLELREALAAAYATARSTPPRWTDALPVEGTTPIRAAHVMEIRAALVALE